MLIGERLKALREEKQMSQGDIEKRTGLLRCYISRVENGHTVPALETLEKMARAMDMPLYFLFYEEGQSPAMPERYKKLGAPKAADSLPRNILNVLSRNFSRMSPPDRKLFLAMSSQMARRGEKQQKQR